MKVLAFFLLVLLSSPCFAGDKEEMRAVMQANFDACNNEDLDALMDTCSVDMPRREEFREDAERLWKEKDIYYSLVEFRVVRVEGSKAVVSVVQSTRTVDRKAPSGRDQLVRNGTGLLTDDECVEYKVAMKKDGGHWKCLLILTEPTRWDSGH